MSDGLQSRQSRGTFGVGVASTVLSWKGDLDWVAVFTIALAGATVWLAWTTRALARETKQEVEHSQRPVIAPTALVGHDPANKIEANPAPGRSRVTVKNVGVGPALNIDLLVDEDGQPAPPDTTARVPALGAGVERREEVAFPTTGELRLHVVYDDVAGKRYLTRARWDPGGQRWMAIETRPEARGA